ncbi:M23 family metallopeptidase [Vallitalea okinawensis]|uniref:M23 family metallopeptidase n=1 Tax=Vallitalea okinawensis TaxID=2078660 RepID=UPI001300B4DF|nr:M23 family metallopeptidase [Vallitalea okinawensis]
MSRLRKHNRKVDRYTTLILMSRSSKNPVSIRIPKWSKYPILLILLCLITYFSMLSYQHSQYVKTLEQENAISSEVIDGLNSEIDQRDKSIENLEGTTKSQFVTLKQLQDQSADVKSDLNTLQEEKTKLEEKLEHTDKTTETKPSSFNDVQLEEELYSLDISDESPRQLRTTALFSDSFEFQANMLYNELEQTKTNINVELNDLEMMEQEADVLIPYWDAYPSIYPTNGTITSYFGWRSSPSGWGSEYHEGIDMRNSYGADVYATGSGTVIDAGYSPSYGYYIVINHGYGIRTKYAHNSQLCVEAGDDVSRGDVIAKIGSTGYSTGPHIHYEIKVDGVAKNPLDFID